MLFFFSNAPNHDVFLNSNWFSSISFLFLVYSLVWSTFHNLYSGWKVINWHKLITIQLFTINDDVSKESKYEWPVLKTISVIDTDSFKRFNRILNERVYSTQCGYHSINSEWQISLKDKRKLNRWRNAFNSFGYLACAGSNHFKCIDRFVYDLILYMCRWCSNHETRCINACNAGNSFRSLYSKSKWRSKSIVFLFYLIQFFSCCCSAQNDFQNPKYGRKKNHAHNSPSERKGEKITHNFLLY